MAGNHKRHDVDDGQHHRRGTAKTRTAQDCGETALARATATASPVSTRAALAANGEAAHGASEAVFVDDVVTEARVYITTIRNLLA
ncbi:MAG TPA: hypothetical protein VFV93_05060 [Thermomicrobiales bacterium]|nr:hypothetical protein [Thermomicrobiales bacterium]